MYTTQVPNFPWVSQILVILFFSKRWGRKTQYEVRMMREGKKKAEKNPDLLVQVAQSYLSAARQLLEDLIDLVFEPSTQHLVGLIQHKHLDAFGSCTKKNMV